MTNSYAWDTALVYIQKCSNDPDYGCEKLLCEYNDKLLNGIDRTGTYYTDDVRCNLYNMQTNLSEFTTEYMVRYSSTLGKEVWLGIHRGGNPSYDGDEGPGACARRTGGNTGAYSSNSYNCGFRAVLVVDYLYEWIYYDYQHFFDI